MHRKRKRKRKKEKAKNSAGGPIETKETSKIKTLLETKEKMKRTDGRCK
jgi:hypothetical protein